MGAGEVRWICTNVPSLPSDRKTLGRPPNPPSLQTRIGRRARHGRFDAEWVSKVITRIGKAAGVIVEQADERTGRPIKYASAHDLRRSCGERLRNAGVPPLVICRVMRHASWKTTRKHYAPGDVQKEAGILRRLLVDSHSTHPNHEERQPHAHSEDN
jgi:integrase